MGMGGKFGFGLVGTGLIAGVHAEALRDVGEGRLVAVCSRSSERGKNFAARYGCRAYGSVEALATDPEVDALLIATPSGSHLEPSLVAAKAGKHVLCEKPLEINLERIDRLIAAHREAGTRLGCIFQLRYMPVLDPIRQALDSGRFGRLTYAGVTVPWWREPAYYADSPWHGDRRLAGGGAMLSQAIHSLDLICDLMPPIEEVKGMAGIVGHDGIETEDVAVGLVRFQGGALGSLYGTTASWPGCPKRFEITGTEGTVICEDDHLLLWRFRDENEGDRIIWERFGPHTGGKAHGVSDPAAISHDLHAACIADFIRSVREGRRFRIEGSSARRPVALIEALLENASTPGRRPV